MSTAYSHTYFLDGKLDVTGTTAVAPVLYVEPDGRHRGPHVSFHIDSKLTAEEQADIADCFARAVASWAAELRANADKQRTTADELAAAKAEIERLRAEQGGWA